MLADLGVGDWSGWWLDGFEIDENVGNFLQNPMRDALGLIDDDTYFELLEFHHQRIADVAQYLTSTRDWDLLMTETHASDYTSHFFLSLADGHSGGSPSVQKRCQEGVARTYASIDRMIGRIRRIADRDTAIFVVSVHIFVNLKGRQPGGIVDEKDYEAVRRDLIATLYDYTDQQTGRRPFALALTREDAEMVNLWGDLVGDVVYALQPEFDGAHGKQMPSVSFGSAGPALDVHRSRRRHQAHRPPAGPGSGRRCSTHTLLPDRNADATQRRRRRGVRSTQEPGLAPALENANLFDLGGDEVDVLSRASGPPAGRAVRAAGNFLRSDLFLRRSVEWRDHPVHSGKWYPTS